MNDVFSSKPQTSGSKGGPISAKKDFIARDKLLLEEKKSKLKKLQSKAEKAEKAGRQIDAETEKLISRLQEIVKNTQNRIALETERLEIISR